MHEARAFRLAAIQLLAQRFIPWRTGKQTVEQPTHIKSGSPADDRETASIPDLAKTRAGAAGVFAGAEDFIGIGDIQQMMRNAAPGFRRHLCRTDVQTAIHLLGVTVDDLAVERKREFNGKSTLARTRWAQHQDEGKVC